MAWIFSEWDAINDPLPPSKPLPPWIMKPIKITDEDLIDGSPVVTRHHFEDVIEQINKDLLEIVTRRQ